MVRETCNQLLGDLSAYLDGEASAELCSEIEYHLAGCEDCRVVVDTMRRTVTLFRSLPKPDLPAHVRERLYKALDLAPFLNPSRASTTHSE